MAASNVTADFVTPRNDPTSDVATICQDLIRIDTSNYGDSSGPGERTAAEYVAACLHEVGIESTILESEPGRANVVAHWGSSKSNRPGLLVHGHLDVVPAQAHDWTVGPFSAEIKDGCIYGRGAVDMKDFVAMVLSVVRTRQRTGRIPDRPVTLAFTADEENGSALGAHWLVNKHRSLFDGCTEAIGEVGGFSTQVGGHRLYLIETGEKGIAWLKLTARGTAGHGSMVSGDNPIVHLAAALVALETHVWDSAPGPSMRALLAKVRELTGSRGGTEELLALFGPAARMLGPGLRNSINSTMIRAGYKQNVVPAEAVAVVDGRFLPGQEEVFIPHVQRVLGDRICVEESVKQPALEYPFSGDLVDAMALAIHHHDPHAHVAPFLMSGGTDAKAWDRIGIRSYGYVPLRLPADLDFTSLFHGVDERVPLDSLGFGAGVLDSFLDFA
jgi:acetylornithine deacetylase/succinyl-diaminopimelate desuccinylase-like protein